MNNPVLQQLISALHEAWDERTGYAGVGAWTPENPARGQCVTSSLVVQDYFKGDIVRCEAIGDGINETHCFNILDDGTILDTTGSQYKVTVSMKPKPVNLGDFPSVRDKRLADDETRYRYNLLKSKVESILDKQT